MDITIKEEQVEDSYVENFDNVDNFEKAVKEECIDDNPSDLASIKIEEHNLKESILESIKTEKDCLILKTESSTIYKPETLLEPNFNLQMLDRTDEKLFKCNMCKYTSNQETDLQRHQLVNHGKTYFKCTNCEYKTFRKGNLKQHLRTHTGEKPFQCTICEYKSLLKSSLKRHMVVHTGIKPYQCAMCDYKCAQKSTLKSHIHGFLTKHRKRQ